MGVLSRLTTSFKIFTSNKERTLVMLVLEIRLPRPLAWILTRVSLMADG